MLAYDPIIGAGYNFVLTIVSLLIAVLITGAGLATALFNSGRRTAAAAAVGGAGVGCGVAAMHYTGMLALEVSGRITWVPGLVVVSVALGISLGAGALYFAARGDDRANTLPAVVIWLGLPAGCLIEVRPLGVLIMRDDAGLDHKILAVPVNDPRMREVHGLQHLASHYLAEVDYFFNIYKDLEGKKSDTYGWEDRLVAHTGHHLLRAALQDLKDGLIDRWGNLTLKGKKSKEVRRLSAARTKTHNQEKQPLTVKIANGTGPESKVH